MTKSVEQIIKINTIVFIVTYIFSLFGLYLNNILALSPINSEYFKPVQFITHLFAHDNLNHVFFNMLFLYLFGPDVEKYFGSKNFWILYLTGGIFGSLFYFFDNCIVIGASGSVFAIMTSYIFTNYNSNKSEFRGNIRSLIAVFIILSEIYSLFIPIEDNVAHLAHVIGSIYGICFFLYIKMKNNTNK